ncbi:MAG: hypothetical protein MRY32_07205 [Rickettsiales bacterium]|nr:hypothetical protein [Rickettsiales bacterium]
METKQITNEAPHYDALYKSDESGANMYDSRFGCAFDKRLTPRELELLHQACEPCIEKWHQTKENDEFVILAFGAGSGRDVVFAEHAAAEHPNYAFRVIAQDIAKEGLNRLAESLSIRGYEEKPEGWTKNNLVIQPLVTDENASEDELTEVIGGFDFLISLYGVFSHIATKAERHRILKLLKQQCRAGGLISVATMGGPMHGRIYQILQHLRQKGAQLPPPLNESGNILATHWDKMAEAEAYIMAQDWDKLNSVGGEFYTCYLLEQFEAELKQAGWSVDKISVANVKTPPQITSLPLDRQTDHLMARKLTEWLHALDSNAPNFAVQRGTIVNHCTYLGYQISV